MWAHVRDAAVRMRSPLGAVALASTTGVLLLCRRRLSSRKPSASRVTFETVDVFTGAAFGGNPLAVCFGAEGLSTRDLQRIAAEIGYSETTFVLPPERDPANTARVRIFSPHAEMPFAGHPNIGTATVLAWRGEVFGRPVGRTIMLEEIAGTVPMEVLVDPATQRPMGAMLTAPEQWNVTHPSVPVNDVAKCLGLDVGDICIDRHMPLVASSGLPFVLAELHGLDALGRSRGQSEGFASSAAWEDMPRKILAYVRTPDCEVADIRARMHRADGTEDAGTGSANCALMGLLAKLSPPPPPPARRGTGLEEPAVSARISQGVEMGRPSLLLGEAFVERSSSSWSVGAVRIGGRCAAVSRGEFVCKFASGEE